MYNMAMLPSNHTLLPSNHTHLPLLHLALTLLFILTLPTVASHSHSSGSSQLTNTTTTTTTSVTTRVLTTNKVSNDLLNCLPWMLFDFKFRKGRIVVALTLLSLD